MGSSYAAYSMNANNSHAIKIFFHLIYLEDIFSTLHPFKQMRGVKTLESGYLVDFGHVHLLNYSFVL